MKKTGVQNLVRLSLKVRLRCHPTSPHLLGFMAISDHQRMGKVPRGCGPQSSAVLIRIHISFRSWAIQSKGDGGFSVGSDLYLFQSGLMVQHRSGQIPGTRSLYSAVIPAIHMYPSGQGSFFQSSQVSSYWSESEVQHYLTWSMTGPAVAGPFRVNKQVEHLVYTKNFQPFPTPLPRRCQRTEDWFFLMPAELCPGIRQLRRACVLYVWELNSAEASI
jgi:hypothetical protein